MKVSFLIPVLVALFLSGSTVIVFAVLGFGGLAWMIASLLCLGGLCGVVMLNWVVKKTPWYITRFWDWEHERYPTCEWKQKHAECDFDVVNLGSSMGQWGFDYAGLPIKGLNWARQPQSLQNDLRLLQTHHQILKKGAYVLITIVPFLGLFVPPRLGGTYIYLDVIDDRYHDKAFLKKAKLLKAFPILFGFISVRVAVAWLRHGRPKPVHASQDERYSVLDNPMTESELEVDALKWVEGWREEFTINNLGDEITDENVVNREIQVRTMRELVDFCFENGYKPVYVIPPVTHFLSLYFTPTFRRLYIYEFLDMVGRDVLRLDYMDRCDLTKVELYFNSFFFNKTGRVLFTKTVLSDIGILTTR